MHETLLMDLIIDPHVVPHFVSYAFLATIIIISLALMVNKSLSLVPGGVQNVVEVVVQQMLNLAEETIGRHWGRPFFPLICTIFMFILVCNLMGLIPGFTSPTSDINTTASMALPVFLATHFFGVRVHGVKYVKHFMGPVLLLAPLMIIVELLSHLARPVTLSIRLFGNMVAKHFLLLVLALLVPIAIPTLVLGLGVLVSVVQAFVFALLTSLYLAGAVEEAH